MHQVFNRSKLTKRQGIGRIRIIYCLVAYIVPLTVILIANLGDAFNIRLIKGDYGTIGPSRVCWMRRQLATIIYFILPVTITVIFNFILYIRIILGIRSSMMPFSTQRKLTRFSSNNSQSSNISIISRDSCTSQVPFKPSSIYTRLSVPLGFTWIVALFGTVVPTQYTIIIRIMSYLFIIANTSQGVVLFLAFGVYKKMFSYK